MYLLSSPLLTALSTHLAWTITCCSSSTRKVIEGVTAQFAFRLVACDHNMATGQYFKDFLPSTPSAQWTMPYGHFTAAGIFGGRTSERYTASQETEWTADPIDIKLTGYMDGYG